MASHEFEKVIEKACTDLDIAGCALLATNRDGSFTYAKSFGKAAIGEDKPFQLDTVTWIGLTQISAPASCTKLLVSLAALHLASSNNLSLDDPDLIPTHLPELASKPILLPPREDAPLPETPRTKPLTLRHLLTHTSGLVYDPLSPLLTSWAKTNTKHPFRGGTVSSRFDSPLAFEPGESWMYGPGIDYAGLLVERVSGGTLEDYLKTHIWEPLGIKDMTFHLSRRPDMQARFAAMSYRSAGGRVAAAPENPELAKVAYLTEEGSEPEGCFGGDGLFATGEEYIKVLRGVLDASLIPSSFADEFFAPQLTQTQADALNGLMQISSANNVMGHTNKAVRKNWGLAGLLLDADDHEGGRKAGTMVWAGFPMLTWFVDRKTDMCGLFVTQLLPAGDQKTADLSNAFVDGVYALVASGSEDNGRL
ncbi:beta-lactamase family protein [Karstenula rhodostoma CBS 690.94]|uniref:Beta-lactamase family protein n=1 Tax=Karstenula rhodostoma CBS 690.94 TaxID=1392251 RepID=A0A9P4UEJ3_9PLEO|nr:beta-lactamase family protein [Karstenula rhodostoma CBS 690.94]